MSEGHAALDPVQFSTTSHGPAEARHTVDDDAKLFAGQFGPVPVQFSAGSHGPAEARHTVDDDAKPSAGQLGPVPVQFSATSHGPAEARQTLLEDWKPSAGHAALDPVQFSATSHAPAEGRHTVLEDWKASAGQAALDPVQFSATSQGPAEARQTVLEDWKPSAGHAALDPVQFSATAQGPAEGRQTVLEDWKPWAGQVALVPVHVSATSQGPAEARHSVPALPAGWLHAPALQVSVVQGLPSSVQPVPFGWKASDGQAELGGASAMSWLIWAVLVFGGPDVDAFEPLAPGLACNASAFSEEASVVVPPELELSTLNRSVMPDGAPTALLSARPKQPTSIVLATVVVIDGVELLAAPSKALMGFVVSTLEYALIPPAMREDGETVKV